MRILLSLGILVIYLAPITITGAGVVGKVFSALKNVEEVYSLYEKYFEEEVAPEIDGVIHSLKREFDYSISDILKSALTEDYERDIEMPMHALFHSMELFFHHPSEALLDDLKTICNRNNPFNVLLNLKYKLEEEESTYFKQLKVFNFKSEYADSLVKELQGTVVKLVLSHGLCRAFSTNNVEGPPKYVEEVAKRVLRLIRKERRAAPNWLNSDTIYKHLRSINIPKCFPHEEANQLETFRWHFKCDRTNSKVIPDCVPPAKGGWERMRFVGNADSNLCSVDFICQGNGTPALTEYLIQEYPFATTIACMRNITRFIYEDLVKNYNYGKKWTVFISPDSCIGEKETNVAEIEVQSFKVTVYFSNPLKSPVRMPFEEIKSKIKSHFWNFLGKICFWNNVCSLRLIENKLINNVYEKLDSYGYCRNRNLCIACTERSTGYVTDSNIDINLYPPCDGCSFVPIVMGPEDGQEEEYPPDDKLDDKNPLQWLNILPRKLANLQKVHEEKTNRIDGLVKKELAEEISGIFGES
ncbi:hypothetical protein FO519_007594 [Halicephalobus sp. NKZ332]|nr:hypothetical protein FO519_007594 [Halicephalobus sp. NKZ332]